MASSARNSGALAYLSPNSVEIACCNRAMTMAATGATRSAAYFTENWKTLLKVSWSFFGFSLEKAGNSMVATGVAKKVIRTTNASVLGSLPPVEG